MTARTDGDSLARAKIAQQAWAASRRMIARGERPGYRIAETGDGETVHVIELPWLGRIQARRGEMVEAARSTIGGWLGVDETTFDVERD